MKSLKLIPGACAAMAAMMGTMMAGALASAQNTQLRSGYGPVFERITSDRVVNLLASNGYSANVVGQTETSDYVEVTTAGGGVFYLSVRACDESVPRQCSMVQPFMRFNADGVTFAQINQLLGEKFVVSYVILEPENKGVIMSKIVLSGGVTDGNILAEIARYIYDVDNFLDAIDPGVIAQINFTGTHALAGVDMPLAADLPENFEIFVNAVGPNAPDFLNEQIKVYVD
ncbi:MAG: YbjN domain-containing protein [Hyphococcus sp.]